MSGCKGSFPDGGFQPRHQGAKEQVSHRCLVKECRVDKTCVKTYVIHPVKFVGQIADLT